MAKKLYVDKLLRLTLTRKGRAIAKHPLLREDVVEAVKATEALPLWEVPTQKAENTPEIGSADADFDWYGAFEAFSADFDPENDIFEAFEASFAEKATKERPNYPSSRGPFAGPHHSYPIKTQQDVNDAARLIGHAKDPAAVRARIISLARAAGFSLPKSWQKASKAMEKDELIAAVLAELRTQGFLKAPEGDEGTVEEPDEATKAKMTNHDHQHAHMSMHGYSYSHTHGHDHASGDMENHADSETAHAHTHSGAMKAEGAETAPEDLDELRAETEGLARDLEAARTELESVKASVATKDAEVASAKSEAETAKAEVVKAKDEAEKAAARQPLTAAPPSEAKKAEITAQTPFDDALQTLLHG